MKMKGKLLCRVYRNLHIPSLAGSFNCYFVLLVTVPKHYVILSDNSILMDVFERCAQELLEDFRIVWYNNSRNQKEGKVYGQRLYN